MSYSGAPRSGVSVRAAVITIALLTVLPLTGLAFYLVDRLAASQVEATRTALLSNARALGQTVEQEIDKYIVAATLMSHSPALLAGDWAKFRRDAMTSLQDLPETWLSVVDPSGQVLVHTLPSSDEPLPKRPLWDAEKRALQTNELQVSDLFEGIFSNTETAFVAVPVTVQGERIVLKLALRPAHFESILKKQRLSPEWSAGVVDGQGRWVARLPRSERTPVGGLASQGWRQALQSSPEGVEQHASIEGPPILNAYTKTKYGWATAVAIRTSALQTPLKHTREVLFSASAGCLLLGLGLAWLIARRLNRSATVLELAAVAIRTEQPVNSDRTGIREYDHAIAALAQASREISVRTSALRDSELRWRSIAETLPNLVWTDLPDGECDWLSSQWGKYTGIPEQELLGLNWVDRVLHPDDRERTLACWRAACEDRGEYDIEYRIRRHDGQYRWFKTRGVPVRDASGKIIYWFGTCTDIEDIRSAERREQLLMQEVNHRAKNMLSLVQAIARQTAFKSPQEFISRFDARLQALAASQNLLVKSGWKEVPLESLVRTQLAHFADVLDTRIILAGPSLKIKVAAAQALGVILHELSTNAAKYGALSAASGRVSIDWNVQNLDGGSAKFIMSWREHGGPSPQPPAKRGFGSTVLERFARTSLSADTSIDFANTGVLWKLNCAIEEIVEHPVSPPPVEPPKTPEIPRNSGGPTRVLIVEDEALPAMETASLLSDGGFEVIGPAASVRQAFQCLDESSGCDAALLDVNLGSETSEAIAQKLFDSGIPFIVVSGYSPQQLPAVFQDAPFAPKPLDHGRLLETLRNLIARESVAIIPGNTRQTSDLHVAGPRVA